MATRIATVRLNDSAFDHAKDLVARRRAVLDERDSWSEHQPSAAEENAYIEKHGWGEFGKWYLGVDEREKPTVKAHYKFPYSDFSKVHRCGVLTAESRAGQRKYLDIEMASAHLHGMLDELMASSRRSG
jgi:hypothetical protein